MEKEITLENFHSIIKNADKRGCIITLNDTFNAKRTTCIYELGTLFCRLNSVLTTSDMRLNLVSGILLDKGLTFDNKEIISHADVKKILMDEEGTEIRIIFLDMDNNHSVYEKYISILAKVDMNKLF